jgi:hypothetical protein
VPILSSKLVGGPGFEPGPHRPKIYAVSSTEIDLERFSSIGKLTRRV